METIIALRIEQLAIMHNLIMQTNQKSIIEEWLNHFPEEATEKQFVYFCKNDSRYHSIVKVFKKLVNNGNIVI